MKFTLHNVFRLLTLLSSLIVTQFASAQNCTLPIPFQYEFQTGVTASLSAAGVGDPCVLSVALGNGTGPTASGFLHYRRASPTTSVRYGFRVDTRALTSLTLANRVIQLFSASSPVVVTSPLSVSHLLRLELLGSTTPQLRFVTAIGGSLPAVSNVALPQTLNTIRVEINVGGGTAGFVRYWINHAFTDPPDGVLDNAGAGLDNAAWMGVIAAEIGLSAPSDQFHANDAGNAVVFDQIESNDDILFWDDFSSGAQQ